MMFIKRRSCLLSRQSGFLNEEAERLINELEVENEGWQKKVESTQSDFGFFAEEIRELRFRIQSLQEDPDEMNTNWLNVLGIN